MIQQCPLLRSWHHRWTFIAPALRISQLSVGKFQSSFQPMPSTSALLYRVGNFQVRKVGNSSDSELRFSSYGVHKIAASVFIKTLDSVQKLSFHAHCLSPICTRQQCSGQLLSLLGILLHLVNSEIRSFFGNFCSCSGTFDAFGKGLKGYPYEKQQ